MKKDKVIYKETEDGLQVIITIPSLKPCVKSIQNYDSQFKPQDIVNDELYDPEYLIDSITENFNDYLYTLMNKNRNYYLKQMGDKN